LTYDKFLAYFHKLIYISRPAPNAMLTLAMGFSA